MELVKFIMMELFKGGFINMMFNSRMIQFMCALQRLNGMMHIKLTGDNRIKRDEHQLSTPKNIYKPHSNLTGIRSGETMIYSENERRCSPTVRTSVGPEQIFPEAAELTKYRFERRE